jgi:hypothetical protein
MRCRSTDWCQDEPSAATPVVYSFGRRAAENVGYQRRVVMLSVEIKENDKVFGVLTAEPKLFKTGSRGFFGMTKIQIGEKRYQVQVQMVEIGSKPKPEEKALRPE